MEVLSAMITPAVLISACGTLILSTSSRLGRLTDRVRTLSVQFEELEDADETVINIERLTGKREMISDQLPRLARRVSLLQRALTGFYSAIGLFVASSVAIGIVSITHSSYAWLPVSIGLLGACVLLYGSVILIFEARLAVASSMREMTYLRNEMNRSRMPADKQGGKIHDVK